VIVRKAIARVLDVCVAVDAPPPLSEVFSRGRLFCRFVLSASDRRPVRGCAGNVRRASLVRRAASWVFDVFHL